MRIVFFLLLLTAAPALAEPGDTELSIAPVEATSTLWRSYKSPKEDRHPQYAADGNIKTAWVEGAEGNGEGERIRFHVAPVTGATRVEVQVRNGCQETKHSFAAHPRVADATVILRPSGMETKVTLADTLEWQTHIVEQPAGRLTAVDLRIESVYRGEANENTCLAEVRLAVDPAAKVDPARQTRRAEWGKAFLKGRHKLGRLFDSKRARAEFPFVERYIPRPDGQSFGIDCRGDNLCAMEEGLRLMQSVVKGAEAEKVGQVLARLKDRAPWKAVALTSADERALPPLDGLCPHGLLRVPCDGGVYLPPTLGHLRAETVSVTPVTIVPTIDQLIVPAHCEGYGVERQVFARLPEGAERPTDLLTIECRPAKGAQPARNAVLMLSYDNDGALSVVTSPEQVALLQWQARPKMPLLTGAHTLVVRSGERVTLEAQSE